MILSNEGIKNKGLWTDKKYILPAYDRDKVIAETKCNPVWIHFGAGNIFRALLANMQEELLAKGIEKTGIIVVEAFDDEIIDKAYRAYDDLCILFTLKSDGDVTKKVLGSVTESLKAEEDWERIVEKFENPSLQMASFTITEKGYEDISENGVLAKIAKLCYHRYLKGKYPISLVSFDNCKDNGKKLFNRVVYHAKRMVDDEGFFEYLSNEQYVAYPWTMIDKITPRPDEGVLKTIADDGIESIDIHRTSKNTYVSAFVNAEDKEYLVIEDKFPNGRPRLEESGVIFTDRETVSLVERMKVSTCLNPLHTALAIFGCLLGFGTIYEEMQDEDLVRLVHTLAYKEGLPVVEDPKVINPEDFLKEVIEDRLSNPFIKDSPKRIATDTSQKLGIRFGETLKAYARYEYLDVGNLVAIPLVFAGWCRYLMGVDDEGCEFEISPDPLLETLQEHLKGVKLGSVGPFGKYLKPILCDKSIFGVDLYEIGLGDKVEGYFEKMVSGRYMVRQALRDII
ncbi:MAG: mannitol dehydrogenase family protein [Clostridia bacterium]